MKAREISKSTKLKIYRTIIRPIVMYGCEGWTMSEHMEEALRVWEREILREVYGLKRDTWIENSYKQGITRSTQKC
jgi:hypothetical protein